MFQVKTSEGLEWPQRAKLTEAQMDFMEAALLLHDEGANGDVTIYHEGVPYRTNTWNFSAVNWNALGRLSSGE